MRRAANQTNLRDFQRALPKLVLDSCLVSPYRTYPMAHTADDFKFYLVDLIFGELSFVGTLWRLILWSPSLLEGTVLLLVLVVVLVEFKIENPPSELFFVIKMKLECWSI